MLFDGLNSLLVSLPWFPGLYPPQNWLRLMTGTFSGIAISTIAYPVFSVSLWHVSRQRDEAVIETTARIAPLPNAATIVLILSRREASAHSWRDGVIPIVMGLAIACLLIEGMGWLKMVIFEHSGINLRQG